MEGVIAMLDAVLNPYIPHLGEDFAAYRNHACRVASFHCLLRPADSIDLEQLAIAAAYHDLGIWCAGSFDYIGPSIDQAGHALRQAGRHDLMESVTAMIQDHHKITRCRADAPPAAETFRRADWMDVSCGLLRFGVSRKSIARVKQQYPNAGFHALLLKLALRHGAAHPLRPLPMLRW